MQGEEIALVGQDIEGSVRLDRRLGDGHAVALGGETPQELARGRVQRIDVTLLIGGIECPTVGCPGDASLELLLCTEAPDRRSIRPQCMDSLGFTDL